MKRIFAPILLFLLLANGYAQNAKPAEERSKIYVSYKGAKAEIKRPLTPDKIWGELFTDVQLTMVLGDNKTFVDAVPKYSPGVILKKYRDEKKSADTSFKLKDFIYENFKVPVATSVKLPEKDASLKKHLDELWPTLTRKADVQNQTVLCWPYPKLMLCRVDVSEKFITGTAILLCRGLRQVAATI